MDRIEWLTTEVTRQRLSLLIPYDGVIVITLRVALFLSVFDPPLPFFPQGGTFSKNGRLGPLENNHCALVKHHSVTTCCARRSLLTRGCLLARLARVAADSLPTAVWHCVNEHPQSAFYTAEAFQLSQAASPDATLLMGETDQVLTGPVCGTKSDWSNGQCVPCT